MLAQEALMSYTLLNNAVFTNPVVVDAIIDIYAPAKALLTDRIFPKVAAQKLNLIDQDLVLLQDYLGAMQVAVVTEAMIIGGDAVALSKTKELLDALVVVLKDMLGLLVLSSKATIPLGATA